ncbi:MAG: Ig-like domain repeat protein [Nocardioides sp.]
MLRPLKRPAVSAVAIVLMAPLAPLAVGLATPAAAADPPDVLAWQISESFDDVSDNHVLADGAVENAEGVISFPRVSGTYHRGTGVAAVTYKGSVAATYSEATFPLPIPIFPETDIYTVTIADPIVTVDATGAGQITAMVSSVAGDKNTAAKRVPVTTFTVGADPWVDADTLGSLTRVPAWDGVLPPDSAEATALGIPAGQPVMGRAFSPQFLGQIVSEARPDYYATGESGDAAKAPAQFVAAAEPTGSELAPAVTVAEVSTNSATGATFNVKGAGFTPGAKGIVIAIGESGITRSTPSFSFVVRETVVPAQFNNDKFETVISAPANKLDPTKDYSLYSVSADPENTSQDTETRLVIDFESLEDDAVVDFSTSDRLSTTYGKGGKIKLKVDGVTDGVITMTDLGPNQRSSIESGIATFVVPKNLAVGSYRATFDYAGDASHEAHQETMTYRVDKTRPKLDAIFKTIKKLVVTITGPKAGRTPTGKVIVEFKPTGKNKSGAVKRSGRLNKKGVATISLPSLKKGTYTFSVRYLGNANYLGQKASRKITIG